MDPSLIFYNSAATLAAGALPALWLADRLSGRFTDLWPRLGLYGNLEPAGPGPRVWLQAVSVGEIAVANAIIDELLMKRPGIGITVTSSTPRGLEKAVDSLSGKAVVAPFPLDLPWPVMAAAAKIRPHVYASLETEIWPNLLAWLSGRGASLLMLNGRLSPRSFPRYHKLKPLISSSLRRFDRLSMITDEDAERIIRLGAPADLVSVDGNAKYAGLLNRAQPSVLDESARIMRLGQSPLLVAGSVRTGEETAVLEAFARVLARHPHAVLAAVPRHVEKSPKWIKRCQEMDLPCQAWSSLSADTPRRQDTRVVVVDAMGVLFGLYGLCKAAFVGASLVTLGGQNPMEPAAWGVPVCYGPSMEDFLDAASALESRGSGRQIPDSAGLADFWIESLDNPMAASQNGEAGREVVSRWSGAAGMAAELILEQLERKGSPK